jgi:hypothetical protein
MKARLRMKTTDIEKSGNLGKGSLTVWPAVVDSRPLSSELSERELQKQLLQHGSGLSGGTRKYRWWP